MIGTIFITGAVLSLCGLARRAMEAGKGPSSLFGGRIQVQKLYNQGSGFGLLPLSARQMIPASLAALCALLRSAGGGLGTGLILGGGLSNLWERLRHGRVLDYLCFPKAPGALKHFTYNLADLAVFLGAVLLLVRRRGNRDRR